LLNWTLLFRKIAATKTLLPVLLSCYCQSQKKKDGNYEITTTTNNMQTGKKKNRKFSYLRKPSPKALRLMFSSLRKPSPKALRLMPVA
jgi:hypothetical protein